MTRAEELIHRFGLQLQDGGLVSEHPLTPAEVAIIRPHRKAILRALTPAPIRLVPMERDTLAERIGPALWRMREAGALLDDLESHGIEPRVEWRTPRILFFDGEHGPALMVPSYLRMELLWLLRETVPALHAAPGLRWLESSGGGAA